MVASRRGHLQAAKFCVENGVNINAVSKTGDSALHLASQNNITELLLCSKANVNKRNQAGDTPLHVF